MKLSDRITLAVGVLAVGLSMEACGGGDEPASTPANEDAGSEAQVSPDAGADALEGGGEAEAGPDATVDATDAQDQDTATPDAPEGGPDDADASLEGGEDVSREAAPDATPDALEAAADGDQDALAEAATDTGGDAVDDALDATDGSDGSTDPILNGPCSTAGALNCNGHAQQLRLLCDGTKWTVLGTCSGTQLCDTQPGPTQGSCKDQIPACLGQQPGALACEGTKLYTCGPDLVTATSLDCPFVCVAGACAGVCKTGEVKCENGNQQVCDATGQWSAGDVCSHGCAGGYCCTSAQTLCGNACLDLQTDALNCGACGHDCLGGSCKGGMCQPITLTTASHPDRLAVDGTTVYWTEPSTVRKISKAGGSPFTVTSIVGPSDIAVDVTNVYFTRWYTPGPLMGALMKVPLAGGAAVELYSNQNMPSAFAIDATDAYINSNGGILARIPLGGGAAQYLNTAAGLTGIAVDASDIYFADASGVRKAPKTGGPAATLATGTVGQIVLDDTFVYYAAGTGVMKVGKAGGDAVVLAADYPESLAVDPVNVYFVNPGNSRIMKIAIGGGQPVVLAEQQNAPKSIVIDATCMYWATNTAIRKLAK